MPQEQKVPPSIDGTVVPQLHVDDCGILAPNHILYADFLYLGVGLLEVLDVPNA